MARAAVTIPSTFAHDWIALPTTDGNVPGVTVKALSADETTGGATFLIHLPPGWFDPQLDWHPATEESFKIAGWSQSGDRVSGTPSYIHRPPGLLHGPTLAEATLGTTFIIRFDAELRIFRVPEGAQDQPLGPEFSADGLVWIPDIERVERRELAGGPWAGATARELRRDPATGGGLVLLDLPAGWEGEGSRGRSESEEFVLAGAVEAGGLELTKWGYACRPAGAAVGRYVSRDGAVLACWWARDERE